MSGYLIVTQSSELMRRIDVQRISIFLQKPKWVRTYTEFRIDSSEFRRLRAIMTLQKPGIKPRLGLFSPTHTDN